MTNVKRYLVLAGLMLILALAIFACPANVNCPIHNHASCYFTGKTQIIDGVLVGVYHCPWNHEVLGRCN